MEPSSSSLFASPLLENALDWNEATSTAFRVTHTNQAVRPRTASAFRPDVNLFHQLKRRHIEASIADKAYHVHKTQERLYLEGELGCGRYRTPCLVTAAFSLHTGNRTTPGQLPSSSYQMTRTGGDPSADQCPQEEAADAAGRSNAQSGDPAVVPAVTPRATRPLRQRCRVSVVGGRLRVLWNRTNNAQALVQPQAPAAQATSEVVEGHPQESILTTLRGLLTNLSGSNNTSSLSPGPQSSPRTATRNSGGRALARSQALATVRILFRLLYQMHHCGVSPPQHFEALVQRLRLFDPDLQDRDCVDEAIKHRALLISEHVNSMMG